MNWEDIGTLAPGKLAGLVAVNSVPLKDIEVMNQVSFVLREIIVVKDEGQEKL